MRGGKNMERNDVTWRGWAKLEGTQRGPGLLEIWSRQGGKRRHQHVYHSISQAWTDPHGQIQTPMQETPKQALLSQQNSCSLLVSWLRKLKKKRLWKYSDTGRAVNWEDMQEVDTNSSSPHPPEVWDPANPATWRERRGGGGENNNTEEKTHD